jgi:hypothetical protein
MTLKRRVEKLEHQAEPDGGYEPAHMYLNYDDAAMTGDSRKDCPTCAAMSDEEYSAYQQRIHKVKHVTHIEVRLARDRLLLNPPSLQPDKASAAA